MANPGQQPITSLSSGLGDLLSSYLMGNQNMPNAANSAMPYLNQIPGTMMPWLSPFANAGFGAIGQQQNQYSSLLGMLPGLQQQYGNLTGMQSGLQQQYGNAASMQGPLMQRYLQMMSNPGAMVNQIGQSFHQSPGYQFQTNQALGAANRAAAAGGMLGSPQEQQNIAGTVNNLANQDYYNYLNHGQNMFNQGMMGAQNMFNTGVQGEQNLYNEGLAGEQGLYGMGLQGEQNLGQLGYGASSNLAESMANALQSQALLQYAGQANQNMFNEGNIGSQGGLLGGALSSYLLPSAGV